MFKSISVQKNLIIFFLIFLFSLFFFNDQVAVRGGLIISGEIKYYDNLSPLKFYFLNSWTLLTQLSALFLKIGFDVKIVSFILVFFLSTILFYSSFLILNKFTNNFLFSILITTFLLFFQKNIGDTDYPSLIFTIHTFGAYAQAFTGLIFATLINNQLRLSVFLSFILFIIHPIVGLWILSIIFCIIFYKKNLKIKEIIKMTTPGLIILIISFIVYLLFIVEKLPYDKNLFETYLNKWDGHRAISDVIHYEYIFKTFLLMILANFLFPKNFKNQLFVPFLNITIISALIVYLSFKFFNLNNLNFLYVIIPGRLLTTFSFIAWPIFIGLIFYKFKNSKYIKKIFYSLAIVYSVMHYKTFLDIKEKFYNNQLIFKHENNNFVFDKLKSINDNNYVIGTANSTFNTLYLSKKPLLLTKTIDFLPYHPYLVNIIKDILVDVYGYNFDNPAIPNKPHLSDNIIKPVFENRSLQEWRFIKKKFNSNYVITPKNWVLDLKLIASDKQFNLYKII